MFSLKICFRCRCATNNGGCYLNQLCQNTNGAVTCGACYVGSSGPFCIRNDSFSTLRVSIFNSNSGLLATNQIIKIILVNGFNVNFNPTGPTKGIFATIYGQTVFDMLPGSYTMLSYEDGALIPLDGVGRQNINITTGLDTYFVLYYVPRNAFPVARTRIWVLTWTPQDASKFLFFCFFLIFCC